MAQSTCQVTQYSPNMDASQAQRICAPGKTPHNHVTLSWQGPPHKSGCATLIQAAPDTQQGASRAHEERPPPWSFGFQTNERYLKWDESAQRQLLKLHVAAKLDKVLPGCNTACMFCHCQCDQLSQSQEVSWVEDKLQELASIIPDLEGKMDRMKADIVMQLVSDTQARLCHICYSHRTKCA